MMMQDEEPARPACRCGDAACPQGPGIECHPLPLGEERPSRREEVARIIDPLAFDHRYVRFHSPGWEARKAKRLAFAVEKADAILDLIGARL